MLSNRLPSFKIQDDFPFFEMAARRQSFRYDPDAALAQLANADTKLGRLIEQAGPFAMNFRSSHSPFEALLESIIYQQLHGKAAATILKRLLATFGDLHPQPMQLLDIPDEPLRAAGVSRNKILALRDLAQKTLDGTVPSLARIQRMPDAEIVERLTEVRGIGVWTVEMLLIFRLGRPDVLPVSDYGVRKGFLLTFGRKLSPGKRITAEMLPTHDEVLRRGERWRPWRSVASWYLWRACDLAKEP
jgi:DNA-3-methyladenine glycosylase II